VLRRRTLRGLLLWYLLIPLGVLWIFNSLMAFYFAKSFSYQAYDQTLFDNARTLAQQIQISKGQVRVNLPTTAWNILHDYESESDMILPQVKWADGEMIAGNSSLTPPPVQTHVAGKPVFYNSVYQDKPIRVAALYIPVGVPGAARELLIQTAETLDKRSILQKKIISGVMLPQLVLILLAVMSVVLGVRQGLLPLRKAREAIANRTERDLGPVSEAGAPYEIQPLLQAINELLLRLSQTLDAQKRFVADAAHQLRTPLTGLIAQSEYALRQTDPNAVQHALDQIKTSAERANRLIHQLLTLARSEASSISSPVFEPVDINELLRQITAQWVPAALDRNIDLGYEGPESAVMVKGNIVLLGEMLGNLLDNAIHYTPRGGRVTVHLSTPAHPLIVVEDNGPGVPVKERERVFERFYRLHGNETVGSGLGLAIVREIANAHGARAWISPGAGGQGTRVSVQFEQSA